MRDVSSIRRRMSMLAIVVLVLVASGCSKSAGLDDAKKVGQEFVEGLNKGDADAVSQVCAPSKRDPKPLPVLVKNVLQKYGKRGVDVSKIDVRSEVAEYGNVRVPFGAKTVMWSMMWDEDQEEWKVVLDDDPLVTKS